MSEHKITLEQLVQVVESTPKRRDELHLLLTGPRPTLFRLSRSCLLVFGLICSIGVITLFVYGDIMLLMTLNAKSDLSTHSSGESLAVQLEREVRVLCWVMTTPKYHKTRAVHILRTWGKRCNKIYFITSAPDDELDTIVLNKSDSYDVLWGKTKAAFTYL